ncbi:MAG: hypothetical protein ACI4UE_02735 [Candidatus Scatovivens sp.]
MDNSRLNEIKDLEYEIRSNRRKLEILESKSYDYSIEGVSELIKSDNLRKVELKNDILSNEQEIRRIQLDEMKRNLAKAYKEGNINDSEYGSSLTIISTFIIMLNSFEEMKNQEFAIERMKINNSNEEHIKRTEDNLIKMKEEHASKVNSFIARYANREFKNGKISKEEKTEYRKKTEISEKEIAEFFEKICEDFGSVLKPNTSISKQNIQQALPKSKILDIVRINSQTAIQLQQLYQKSNLEDSKIYAIHHLDEKSVDRIDLFCFDSKTGKMEELCDKENLPELISEERTINVSGYRRKEIKTLSCLGLKLSFYKNPEGKMSVAKSTEGELKDVSVKKLGRKSRIAENESEANKKIESLLNKYKKSLNGKVEATNDEEDKIKTEPKTAEELHQRNNTESIDSNWRQLIDYFREHAKVQDEEGIDKAEHEEFSEFKEGKGGRMW